VEAKIKNIKDQLDIQLKKCKTVQELNEIKVRFFGKKSELSSLLGKIREISPEKRPIIGKLINDAKQKIGQAINDKKRELEDIAYQTSLEKELLDITMPANVPQIGARHPIYTVQEELEDIFSYLGFEVAEGPDIETEYYNFDALNTPKNHPSRSIRDTFYTKSGALLRTHTSPVQIRIMEKYQPPIKIVAIGRCYRNDKPDASHMPVFHQIEALVVDEGISFADLKGTMDYFVKQMFGVNIRSRFRPHFFPFTEPSAEMDILCVNCKGKGCRVCKGSGWLELGGAGMVDPSVLEEVGYDTEKFTGFAFGFGIDRITMLKYNIPYIRILFQNDKA